MLKLQNKVKELERQRTELEEKLERYEEETPQGTTDTAVISDSAFNALKVRVAIRWRKSSILCMCMCKKCVCLGGIQHFVTVV